MNAECRIHGSNAETFHRMWKGWQVCADKLNMHFYLEHTMLMDSCCDTQIQRSSQNKGSLTDLIAIVPSPGSSPCPSQCWTSLLLGSGSIWLQSLPWLHQRRLLFLKIHLESESERIYLAFPGMP